MICLSTENVKKVPNVRLQSMPVLIDHNGAARVNEFLVPVSSKGKTQTFDEIGDDSETAFRGRVLKGELLKLPDDCKGYVFREDEQETNDSATREWQIVGKFDKFVAWNREQMPAQSKHRNWLNWTKLSSTLAEPISDERRDTSLARVESEVSSARKRKAEDTTANASSTTSTTVASVSATTTTTATTTVESTEVETSVKRRRTTTTQQSPLKSAISSKSPPREKKSPSVTSTPESSSTSRKRKLVRRGDEDDKNEKDEKDE